MLVSKPAGRNATVIKYDILTALGTHALALDKGKQRLVLRFMTLITARYNWARDELAVGQREMARMWHVDERTVKREMAKLRALGWLVVKRQGYRGRVSEYGINLDRILRDTQGVWAAVGPDFEHRLSADDTTTSNVVPMPVSSPAAAPDMSDGSEWSLIKGLMHAEDPAGYTAWIQALTRQGRAGGRLTLMAPSRFHATYVMAHLIPRLLAACRDVDSDVSEIVVVS